MVYLEPTQYKGWKGYRLGNSFFEVIVAPEIGGRMISFSIDGNEVLFTTPYLRGQSLDIPDEIEDMASYRRERGWLMYGGHKTWLAPQDRWDGPPYLDLDGGSYCVHICQHTHKKAEIIIQSPVCRETGMQLLRRVRVTGSDRSLWIYESMANRGDREVEYALWDVTQIKSPGEAIFPLGNSRYPDGIKSFSSEHESLKPQVLTVKDGQAELFCRPESSFRYGTDFSAGWISARIPSEDGGEVEFTKRFKPFKDAAFAHDCAVAVYNSGDHPYFETQIQSPLVRLKPQEEFGFEQLWEIKLRPKK